MCIGIYHYLAVEFSAIIAPLRAVQQSSRTSLIIEIHETPPQKKIQKSKRLQVEIHKPQCSSLIKTLTGSRIRSSQLVPILMTLNDHNAPFTQHFTAYSIFQIPLCKRGTYYSSSL